MKTTILICLLLFISLSFSQKIPFSRLFMQTHEAHPIGAKSFFWGVSGNVTFFLDENQLYNNWVTVTVLETEDKRLFEDDEAFLANYTEISRNGKNVSLSFKAIQIALSVYPPEHCGMFLDIEDTIDIDIPIDMLVGRANVKIMFNFIFEKTFEKDLLNIYRALEKICKVKEKEAVY